MGQTQLMNIDNYSAAGDVAAIAVCVVMVILLTTAYVSRTKSFHIFMAIICLLMGAAIVNIICHNLMAANDPPSVHLINVLRIVYNALLFDVFFLFSLYAAVISGMKRREARLVAIISTVLLVGIVGIDVIQTVSGAGAQIAESGEPVGMANIYMIGFVLFVILLAMLMHRVRTLVYRRVMYGFYGTMVVSLGIRFAQLLLGRSSLTTMPFVFPLIAMLYIMHSNPYNVTLGAVDVRAMENMVREMYARKEQFVFISLLLPEFDAEGKELPEALRAEIRRFAAEFFRKCVLFQISNAHMLLIAPKRRNPDYERQIGETLEAFQAQFERFHCAYKLVVGESIEEISRKNEYASLIRSIERDMPENTARRIGPDEIDRFNRAEYILQELKDIYRKRDMDDPRVLAYCQPVYDLRTGRFDRAEALMRLKLEKTGIVFPDQFIPLAEDYGYIHVLTEIILNKTCRAIRRLSEEGLQINRVSVNVSVLELKDDGFCGDINRIIDDNRISGERIALELTESHSEADFMIMKEKIEELRRQGVQFYLDDFGTGYSNMERIMELPFDIIKFDRSMVIASGTDDRSGKIVENLAHMFRDMEYAVLYEGIESDTDEARCREMSAVYLQGYKYSRPVPIEQLRGFLSDAG